MNSLGLVEPFLERPQARATSQSHTLPLSQPKPLPHPQNRVPILGAGSTSLAKLNIVLFIYA